MPSITKKEYENLKSQIKLLKARLVNEELIQEMLERKILVEQRETEKWKRYYDAVREVLKPEERVEIPGCFNMTESVQYIIKRQEED